MAKDSKLGWFVAGAVVLLWIGSRDDKSAISTPEPTGRVASVSSQSESEAPESARPKQPERVAAVQPVASIEAGTGSTPVPLISRPAASTLYTTANVRLRQEPSTSASIVRTIPPGTRLAAFEADGAWYRVTLGSDEGWVHRDYVSGIRPSSPPKPPPPVQALAPLRAPAQSAPPRSRSGQPVRDPYVGTCDCPYDRMRNGRSCGGRSAYSRPGGRSPACYF